MGVIDPSGKVQLFMDLVGNINEGVDIKLECQSCFIPCHPLLSHCGEFSKVLHKHVRLLIGFPQGTPARLVQHVKATAG